MNSNGNSNDSHSIDLKGHTILLVEDDGISSQVFEHFFRKTGATIISTTNGRQALDLLESGPATIDIIFMDIAMPVLGGTETAEMIRSMDNYAHVPIIAWTATSPQEILKIPGGVFDDYLIKPTEMQVIIEAAAKWIKVAIEQD
jgi:CheY-like chemotaxis protein